MARQSAVIMNITDNVPDYMAHILKGMDKRMGRDR